MLPITLVFPWFVVAGAAGAAAMVVAHLIALRTRAPRPLPTARFVPRASDRTAVIERRPRDKALLALRAGALLLAGLALAGPVTVVGERELVRVAIADYANARDTTEVADSVRAIEGARVVESSPQRSLTGAFVQALQLAGELGQRGHPVQLSLISPLTEANVDSATLAVRGLWPARVRLVPVAAAPEAPRSYTALFRGPVNDPLRFAVAQLNATAAATDTIIVSRLPPTPADSAMAERGHAVVHMPPGGISTAFAATARADTVYGLAVEAYTMITALERGSRVVSLDVEPGTTHVVARWIDGAAAAVERSLGAGCVREVGFAVPDAGDIVVSRSFHRVLSAIAAPCGVHLRSTPLGGTQRAALAGTGDEQAVFRPVRSAVAPSPAAPLLLLLVVAMLVAELIVRRRRT
jgi:hypothetical protein